MQTGRVKDALAELEEGTRLDPLYTIQLGFKGWGLASLGRADEARATLREALALDPKSFINNTIQEWVLSYVGTPDEAAAQAGLCDSPDARQARPGGVAGGTNRVGEGRRAEARRPMACLESHCMFVRLA